MPGRFIESKPASPKPSFDVRTLLESTRRPLVMGVVNATPDSFYPASRRPDAGDAIAAGLAMAEEGADILDIGGQSTRPGSDSVTAQEEIFRVIPVVEALSRQLALPVSIDTDKAEVARACLEAGARILNDVSALRGDPGMAAVARDFEAVILMHIQGDSPKTMQDSPSYDDVVTEVKGFLADRKELFLRAGGDGARLLFDPGIGFGKTPEHNLSLIKHIEEFSALGPVVLGASRKSFLGRIMTCGSQTPPGPEERLEGSLAVACWAALHAASVLRVHDVRATVRALQAVAAVRDAL